MTPTPEAPAPLRQKIEAILNTGSREVRGDDYVDASGFDWFILRDQWAEQLEELVAQERKPVPETPATVTVGIDWAKPGSDKTAMLACCARCGEVFEMTNQSFCDHFNRCTPRP